MVNQNLHALTKPQKEVLLERISRGIYPPHLTIAFAWHKILAWPAERMVRELYEKSLSQLEFEMERELARDGFDKTWVMDLFDPLRQLLKKPLNVIEARQFKRDYPALLTRLAGDTSLRDYFNENPATQIAEYWDTGEELILIANAILEKPGAYDRLYQSCEEPVRGFIRFKLRDWKNVDDIAQETWIAVKENFSAYNPAFTDFASFAKYWAGLVINKDRDKAQKMRHGVIVDDFADAEDEWELGEMIARRNPDHAAPSPEEIIIEENDQIELLARYEKLWRITFNCDLLPHLLLTFGFNKLLGEKPKEIVAQKSARELKKLGEQLEKQLLAKSQLAEAFIKENMKPLHGNMAKTFANFTLDRRTRETLPASNGRTIGLTTLKEYYRLDPPEDNIPMWSQMVKMRILRHL